jgi:ABC-type transport system involved in multi-copper enzyme maturation permease subunit
MKDRIATVAFNTFREAVRDRVLYNLIVFALLLVASSFIFGQISIGIERLILVNLSLTAISVFGIVIAIFIGIGLVSKEIEKKTLYTILARPLSRWEFIVGKFFGLAGTLIVNVVLMSAGFFGALFFQMRHFQAEDRWLLVAVYFIILELILITAIALLFSTYSSPLMSSIFTLAILIIGIFAEDLRTFAAMMHGLPRWIAIVAARIVPNFGSLNVISSVAHGQPVAGSLIFYNTIYALLYSAAAVAGAILIFERRNLK